MTKDGRTDQKAGLGGDNFFVAVGVGAPPGEGFVGVRQADGSIVWALENGEAVRTNSEGREHLTFASDAEAMAKCDAYGYCRDCGSPAEECECLSE